ncbi:MAG: hypothetical protein QM760_22130 [Nibricoccus sp.]
MQWPGGNAAESLSGEKLEKGYSAYIPALEAAHKVGSKVVHELVGGWGKYETKFQGSEHENKKSVLDPDPVASAAERGRERWTYYLRRRRRRSWRRCARR